MGKLAIAIITTSQGIPFLHAGTEILRSKGGHHDSYRSPDLLNQIKWKRKSELKGFFEFTRKCIELRDQHPAFRMRTEKEIGEKLKFFKKYIPGVVCYELGDYANNDSWRRVLVLLNGNNYSVEVEIPEEEWMVIAQDSKINSGDRDFINSPIVKLHRISMMVLAVD
jgi:pullulanase